MLTILEIIFAIIAVMTIGYLVILWFGGVTIQRSYSIACQWDSKRWTLKRICRYYALWALYRLIPGKGKTRFCIPGPTSKSHPFGWITPQVKEPHAGSDYIIMYSSGKTEYICDFHAEKHGVCDLAPIFRAKVYPDTNGICRECVDQHLNYNFPEGK